MILDNKLNNLLDIDQLSKNDILYDFLIIWNYLEINIYY